MTAPCPIEESSIHRGEMSKLMKTRMVNLLLATTLAISASGLAACERQDLKEAEKVGDDVRKGLDRLEDEADQTIQSS
jgi:hypothetical protein